MKLCDLSAYEISKKIKSKEFSAEEVLDASLERIRRVDGRPGSLEPGEITEEDRRRVHAFITLTEKMARSQAQDVDRKIAAGDDPGLLAGVPITIKDVFCVKDTLSTIGSRILGNFVAPYTATSAERLRESGTVLLGKVNLDEFTYGSSTESSAFQPSTRNPWDTGRVPGGSSGGSTASVAAGEAALSLGTDTAGSIRQPAAFCGVVGLKPTYGRVSRYGLIAFGSSLDCPGPVARSAKDTALMLQVISGVDAKDATSANVPVDDYMAMLEQDIKGKRIGLSPDYFNITYPDPHSGDYEVRQVPPSVKDAVIKAAEIFRALGAEIIEDVPMPNTRFGIPVYFVISRVEAASNLHRFDGVKYGYRTQSDISGLNDLYRKSRGEGFGPQPKMRILMGMYVSAAQYSDQYYKQALKARTLIRRDFEAAFNPSGKYKLDAMLTPTTPTTAFPMENIYGDSVMMQYADQLTVPANHAGIPGISFPGGLDDAGLPLGLQLLGSDFSEGTLLQMTHAFESATANAAWRQLKPAVLRRA